MKIQKIINNNAVYGLNDSQEEVIMMGAGIGYKKQIGETVVLDKVDKVFFLRNEKFEKFEELFKRVDSLYFNIAMAVSQKAEESLMAKMSSHLVFALADHIFFAVSQYKNGVFTPNLMLHEIKMLYPKEYHVGIFGRTIIYKKTGVKLPKDEAGYIALHILNSKLAEESEEVNNVIILMHGIGDIVKTVYGKAINEDTYEYALFVLEIKRLAHRISNHCADNLNDVEGFIPLLLDKRKELATVIEKISLFIKIQFDYSIAKEEQVYLMMHIFRIIR